MQHIRPRRNFLKLASVISPIPMLGSRPDILGLALFETGVLPPQMPVTDLFPTQPPELAREMVTVSHFSLKRVMELVEARPSLTLASWDWGFGDWETPIGAASHMGNRPIAEYLISKGAPPSLFSATMLGQVEVVKAFIGVQPGVQRIRGPHSISLLAHAKAGGKASRPVLDYLTSLGGADADPLIPLTAHDVDGLLGTYVFGSAANEQIEVTGDHTQVVWTRRGAMGRPLFYLGENAFYPAGAPAVHIRFTKEGTAMLMTIGDPKTVLTARRSQQAK